MITEPTTAAKDTSRTSDAKRARSSVPLTAKTGTEFNSILRALHAKSGLTKAAVAKAAEIPPGAVSRMLDKTRTSLPEHLDRVLAVARACGLDGANLDRLAELWRNLSDGLSGDRRAHWARTTYAERDGARVKVDGKWVSTLLGTPGHPDHGAGEVCWTMYRCRCPLCRSAHAAAFVAWDTEQRTTRRLGITQDVLVRSWPGDESPSKEELAKVAEAALARYLETKRWRVKPVATTLLAHWPDATEEQATTAAEALVDALAVTSRRSAKGVPRD